MSVPTLLTRTSRLKTSISTQSSMLFWVCAGSKVAASKSDTHVQRATGLPGHADFRQLSDDLCGACGGGAVLSHGGQSAPGNDAHQEDDCDDKPQQEGSPYNASPCGLGYEIAITSHGFLRRSLGPTRSMCAWIYGREGTSSQPQVHRRGYHRPRRGAQDHSSCAAYARWEHHRCPEARPMLIRHVLEPSRKMEPTDRSCPQR